MVLPTAVMAGIPHLAGSLQARGIHPTVIDLGIDFANAIMTRDVQSRLLTLANERVDALNRQPSLDGRDVIEFAPLVRHASLKRLPEEIENAISVFRDERLYDFEQYYTAARTAHDAMGLLSATLSPFRLSFGDMRSRLHRMYDRSDELWRALDDWETRENNIAHEILVKLLDQSLEGAEPKLVGISICYHQQLIFGLWVARELRKRFPATQILLGGPTVAKLALKSHQRGQYPLFRDADAIAVGDGEETIVEVAESVLGGERLQPIYNVIVYDRAKKRGELPGIKLLRDLNSAPPADYRVLDLDKYWNPRPSLPLTVARGCYWDKCTFCHFGAVTDPKRVTSPYREMSISTIVERMQLQDERHGARMFSFVTDAASPAFLAKVASALSAAGRSDLKWSVQARAEKNFRRERTDALNKGGCIYVFFGLESMDDQVLRDIDKGTTADQYSRVLTDFYDSGIATGAMGFFDFPTEDFAAAKRSLEFLREHVPVISELNWGHFQLEQGARIYQEPDKYGISEIVEDPDADLACMVSYRLRKSMKTEAEAREIEIGLGAIADIYHAEFERPFLAGSRCEHSMFYYERFGPGALKQFAEFAIKRTARLNGEQPSPTLRLDVDARSYRYPVVAIFDREKELIERLKGSGGENLTKTGSRGQGKLIQLGGVEAFEMPAERLAGWDAERGNLQAEASDRRILATPWKSAAVNDDVWELLEFFSAPKTLGELESLLGDANGAVELVQRALESGWLRRVEAQPDRGTA